MKFLFTLFVIYIIYRIIKRLLLGPQPSRFNVHWQKGTFGNRPDTADGVYGKRENGTENIGNASKSKRLQDIQDAEFEEINDRN
jgi:hypothetical protein